MSAALQSPGRIVAGTRLRSIASTGCRWIVLCAALTALFFASSVQRYTGPETISFRSLANADVATTVNGGVACSRSGTGAHAPYLCGIRRADRAWGRLVDVCSRLKLAHSAKSRFIIRAPVWQMLRLSAFGALAVEGESSSTFPLNTSVLPWSSLPALESPSSLLRHKLLVSPTFMFESTFDVLVAAQTVCAVASVLAYETRAAALSLNTTARDADGALATALLTPERHVLAIAANDRRGRESPFWRSVFTAALLRQHNLEGDSAAASMAWCAAAGGEFNDGSASAAALEATTSTADGVAQPNVVITPAALSHCRRAWVKPSALRTGLISFQRMLFTRSPVTRLHDRKAILGILPTLGVKAYEPSGEVFRGVQQYSREAINRGFNPPDVHSLAGSFLTAYNMVITEHGAMLSLVPPSDDDDAKGMFYHTTCEGPQVDAISHEKALRLPLYEDVIVLTHRHEWNIYHWTAETLGKLAPVLDFVSANPRVKLHVLALEDDEAPFRQRHMDLLGIAWHDRVVDGFVRAKRVHYVDPHECRFPYAQWVILLREHYRRALGYANPRLLPPSMLRAAAEQESEGSSAIEAGALAAAVVQQGAAAGGERNNNSRSSNSSGAGGATQQQQHPAPVSAAASTDAAAAVTARTAPGGSAGDAKLKLPPPAPASVGTGVDSERTTSAEEEAGPAADEVEVEAGPAVLSKLKPAPLPVVTSDEGSSVLLDAQDQEKAHEKREKRAAAAAAAKKSNTASPLPSPRRQQQQQHHHQRQQRSKLKQHGRSATAANSEQQQQQQNSVSAVPSLLPESRRLTQGSDDSAVAAGAEAADGGSQRRGGGGAASAAAPAGGVAVHGTDARGKVGGTRGGRHLLSLSKQQQQKLVKQQQHSLEPNNDVAHSAEVKPPPPSSSLSIEQQDTEVEDADGGDWNPSSTTAASSGASSGGGSAILEVSLATENDDAGTVSRTPANDEEGTVSRAAAAPPVLRKVVRFPPASSELRDSDVNRGDVIIDPPPPESASEEGIVDPPPPLSAAQGGRGEPSEIQVEVGRGKPSAATRIDAIRLEQRAEKEEFIAERIAALRSEQRAEEVRQQRDEEGGASALDFTVDGVLSRSSGSSVSSSSSSQRSPLAGGVLSSSANSHLGSSSSVRELQLGSSSVRRLSPVTVSDASSSFLPDVDTSIPKLKKVFRDETGRVSDVVDTSASPSSPKLKLTGRVSDVVDTSAKPSSPKLTKAVSDVLIDHETSSGAFKKWGKLGSTSTGHRKQQLGGDSKLNLVEQDAEDTEGAPTLKLGARNAATGGKLKVVAVREGASESDLSPPSKSKSASAAAAALEQPVTSKLKFNLDDTEEAASSSKLKFQARREGGDKQQQQQQRLHAASSDTEKGVADSFKLRSKGIRGGTAAVLGKSESTGAHSSGEDTSQGASSGSAAAAAARALTSPSLAPSPSSAATTTAETTSSPSAAPVLSITLAAASASPSPRPISVVLLRRQNDRRILNERDLIYRLERLKGVTVTELADWSLPDQAVIFHIIANADVVIGVHGAGLTNTIIARPGTCIVEFMPADWFVPCYWRMSGQLGLQHHLFVVEGAKAGPVTVPVMRAIAAVRDCMQNLA